MDIVSLGVDSCHNAAEILRNGFRTVANDFGLTMANCPSNPAFITDEQLREQVENRLLVLGAYADEQLVGVVAYKSSSEHKFYIEKLAVLPEYRHRRIGAKLLTSACERILREGGDSACIGIIDENSVLKQWYLRQGFVVTHVNRYPHLPFTVCLMEKPLTQSMLDDADWAPLAVDELARIFREISVPWWISGGWALDLYLGRQTRPHADTDVLILRRDQLTIQDFLSDWRLYKTHQPGLAPWPTGEYLHPPVNSIWVGREDDGFWAFEIMLMETEGDEWVYRRLSSIRGPIADIGMRTSDGTPYVAPEIQLLYKGGGAFREKDTQDLLATLPHLPLEKRAWLLDCLRRQFPNGHVWVPILESSINGNE